MDDITLYVNYNITLPNGTDIYTDQRNIEFC